jgi:hypothetical protein
MGQNIFWRAPGTISYHAFHRSQTGNFISLCREFEKGAEALYPEFGVNRPEHSQRCERCSNRESMIHRMVTPLPEQVPAAGFLV